MRPMRHVPVGRIAALACASLGLPALGACGSARGAPTAESTARAPAPDLGGRPVMLLPVQGVVGLQGSPDAELAFAVEGRQGAGSWVLPPELARALRGNPSLDARLEDLPVGMFLRTEVRRVGDPLFGILRRLGALTGADLAVIPVVVRYREPVAAVDTAGTPAEEEGAVEIATAVLAVRTGQVLWYGVVAGEPGPRDAPAALASAMDALVKRLLPTGTEG